MHLKAVTWHGVSSKLSDEDLAEELRRYGEEPGPIMEGTREEACQTDGREEQREFKGT